jgi:two-component system LytT family response regulator
MLFRPNKPFGLMETTLQIIAKSRKNVNRKKLSVSYKEVVLFKADVNYTEIYLENGEYMIVSKTLKEMEQRFAKNISFVRTHKSFMVNIAHVVSFQLNDGMTIKLSNNEVANLSRRRKDDFLHMYRSHAKVVSERY